MNKSPTTTLILILLPMLLLHGLVVIHGKSTKKQLDSITSEFQTLKSESERLRLHTGAAMRLLAREKWHYISPGRVRSTASFDGQFEEYYPDTQLIGFLGPDNPDRQVALYNKPVRFAPAQPGEKFTVCGGLLKMEFLEN